MRELGLRRKVIWKVIFLWLEIDISKENEKQKNKSKPVQFQIN
jgi:hypothetical protein